MATICRSSYVFHQVINKVVILFIISRFMLHRSELVPNTKTSLAIDGNFDESPRSSEGLSSLLPLVDSNSSTNLTETEYGKETQTNEETSLPTSQNPLLTTDYTATILNPTKIISQSPIKELVCVDDNYCLNGGTCVANNLGQMVCICPEGFYGARCQTRNICQTVIVDNMTGDQICEKIDQKCLKNDKFLRCSCLDDEYFVIKINQTHSSLDERKSERDQQDFIHSRITNSPRHPDTRTLEDIITPPTTDYESMRRRDAISYSEPDDLASKESTRSYIAECRKIDKCLEVRCRRLSEVCANGTCVCNQESGYSRDQKDGLCKLLNPCVAPTGSGEAPICGQARCVATYDYEIYQCICPVGYKALKITEHKNSTQCVPLKNTICVVPLLNNCQHTCTVDTSSNGYKCSCLNGYKKGTEIEVDDHLCYFNDHIEQDEYIEYRNTRSKIAGDDFSTERSYSRNSDEEAVFKTYPADTGFYIKREISTAKELQDSIRQGRHTDAEEFSGLNLSKLSAQERCNIYCEENKICVLEEGSTDSYRCVCDRQGFVSVGDRCLDWCSAAEFSYKVRDLLEKACLSGVCRPDGSKPANPKLKRETSWRPTFECDCSNTPILVLDEETRLCKLDFAAVLAPCLPGNVGYVDCVENKNSYCAVLHRPNWAFVRDLQKERPIDSSSLMNTMKGDSGESETSGANKMKKVKEKLYTCVCSPEKKFLVDKPRNKARCIDECDLLNNECGRFNRMCRPATISPDDFGRRNLVKSDLDGVRMNFKRTRCECLPGFNVGSYKSLELALDENDGATLNMPSARDNYFQLASLLDNDEDYDEFDHHRAKYMNVNSRCLLDYDVVEFHASFKAPTDFDPNWIKFKVNPTSKQTSTTGKPKKESIKDWIWTNETVTTINSTTSNENIKSDRLADERNESPPFDAGDFVLHVPDFMKIDISEFHKNIVLVAQCDALFARTSIDAYQECIKYRYWIVQKLRNHFVDWRRIMKAHLSQTFDFMDGNIKVHVNKCEATLKRLSLNPIEKSIASQSGDIKEQENFIDNSVDLMDEHAFIDADIHCALTLHSSSEGSSHRDLHKVLLEKQLQRFIFDKSNYSFGDSYYLMAPHMLIRRESFDRLAEHRQSFNPCESDYIYCDKQTKCEMVDTVNFTCTCETGYTPIGSRDIFYADSRKEVCEDINECLFDACKDLANVSTCINEIGDYKCRCNRHYIGDNKKFCTHVCVTIPCKHGRCRLVDEHHAFCDCDDGYKETDCSVQDPNVALRKANMIICGSIFTSVLLLAITLAVSLNSQLKKTKKKLKRLEAVNEAARLLEMSHQQPFRTRMSSKIST